MALTNNSGSIIRDETGLKIDESLKKLGGILSTYGTAYEAAVESGYTGTYEEFSQQQATYGRNAAAADALWGSINRVRSLDNTVFVSGTAVEVVGAPVYVEHVTDYSEYNIADPGWYVFARVTAPAGVLVTADTAVTGAEGTIMTVGADHVDVALRFEVASMSKVLRVDWGELQDTYVFKATDLAIRNLDYRTTFYVYDAAPYATYSYGLTADTAVQENKTYWAEDNGEYVVATNLTVGAEVPANTLYEHSKITFAGLTRNVTYKYDPIIDCPMEFILPEIEDETHGCWFEIRCQHAGEYSMTLVPPSTDVKIATEHTQKETAGINMIDLHYTKINNVKLWRFMNTHSSIPT